MTDDPFGDRYAGIYPGDSRVRARLVEVWRWYRDSKLAEPEAVTRLQSCDDAIFWQQLSELLVAHHLCLCGLRPTRQKAGPDFLIEHAGQRTWIEVICPEPKGIPDEWLAEASPNDVRVYSLPHEQMLLRWTAAIKEKFEKLCGTPERPERGYLAKEIVQSSDAFVIAVNGRLLRRHGLPQIVGISQYPFCVEATLAVGPYAVTIDRRTLKMTDGGLQHRPCLPKPNGASVPADTFFDQRYASISAVWGFDFDENAFFHTRQPSMLVHNHRAGRRIERGLLPVHSEYSACVGDESYTVEKWDGRLPAASA